MFVTFKVTVDKFKGAFNSFFYLNLNEKVLVKCKILTVSFVASVSERVKSLLHKTSNKNGKFRL